MRLSFLKSNRRSIVVRNNVVGNNGIRKVSNDNIVSIPIVGGVVQFIYSALNGLRNCISTAVTTIIESINFTEIWDWITRGTIALINFDFNISDEEIEASINEKWNYLKERMISLTGQVFGYLACNALPFTRVLRINKALATTLLSSLPNNQREELINEISFFAGELARSTIDIFALKFFKNARNLIKRATKNERVRAVVSRFIDPTIIDEWGNNESKRWSLATLFENRDRILSTPTGEAAQDFLRSAANGCFDIGYIIDETCEDEGFERVIYFQPDSRVADETFVLRNTENNLKTQILNILSNKLLIDNREIAVNFPSEEFNKIPITNNNGIEVIFEFFKFEQPPYWSKERRKNNGRQRITLTNVSRDKLNFNTIKEAWSSNFMSGKIQLVVSWSNGRKSRIFAETEQEGIKVANILSTFTDYEIVKMTPVGISKLANQAEENLDEGYIHPQYLAAIHVTNWEKLTMYEKHTGNLPDEDAKNFKETFKMHYKQEPSWWQPGLDKLFGVTPVGEVRF